MAQELMDMTVFERCRMAAAFVAELDPNQESLSDGIGSSYAIIKYKGRIGRCPIAASSSSS